MAESQIIDSRPDAQGHPWRLGKIWLTSFFASALLYVSLVAPGILWGDSGQMQLRILTGQLQDLRELARSHVTYIAMAFGLSKLMGGYPVQIANYLSAVAGALTIANFAVLCGLLLKTRTAVICGTCLLLFSHTLWQMASGAEVITFSTMMMSAELVCFVVFARGGSAWWLGAAALANGLGWSTHNFALLMWPAYVITFLACPLLRSRLSLPRVLVPLCGWLIGVVPLAVSLLMNKIKDDGDIDHLQSLFVGIYADNVFNLGVSFGMVSRVLAYACLNFPTPLLLLLPMGIRVAWKTLEKPVSVYLLVAAITYFAFAARYNVPDQYTFLTHSYPFAALFIALAVDRVLLNRRGSWLPATFIALSCVAPLFYAVLPPIAEQHLSKYVKMPFRELPYRPAYKWFLQPWRAGYTGAEKYATQVLESLPQNAILLDDSTTGRPLDLVQATRNLRPDIKIPGDLFFRPWTTPYVITKDDIARFAKERRLFSTNKKPQHWKSWNLDRNYQFVSFGLAYQVLPHDNSDSDPTVNSEPDKLP